MRKTAAALGASAILALAPMTSAAAVSPVASPDSVVAQGEQGPRGPKGSNASNWGWLGLVGLLGLAGLAKKGGTKTRDTTTNTGAVTGTATRTTGTSRTYRGGTSKERGPDRGDVAGGQQPGTDRVDTTHDHRTGLGDTVEERGPDLGDPPR